MTSVFADLSNEGKLAKIEQHLGTGHPVKAEWVRWLIDEFDDGRIGSDDDMSDLGAAFHDQSTEGKLAKLKKMTEEVDVPASWVAWFLESYLPASEFQNGEGK